MALFTVGVIGRNYIGQSPASPNVAFPANITDAAIHQMYAILRDVNKPLHDALYARQVADLGFISDAIARNLWPGTEATDALAVYNNAAAQVRSRTPTATSARPFSPAAYPDASPAVPSGIPWKWIGLGGAAFAAILIGKRVLGKKRA